MANPITSRKNYPKSLLQSSDMDAKSHNSKDHQRAQGTSHPFTLLNFCCEQGTWRMRKKPNQETGMDEMECPVKVGGKVSKPKNKDLSCSNWITEILWYSSLIFALLCFTCGEPIDRAESL